MPTSIASSMRANQPSLNALEKRLMNGKNGSKSARASKKKSYPPLGRGPIKKTRLDRLKAMSAEYYQAVEKARNLRMILLRNVSSPAQMSEEKDEDWLDRTRQYPTLCSIMSSMSGRITISDAKRYLRLLMPSLYPVHDISVSQDLFEKRSYLETILMVPDADAKLAMVLQFWNRLGGLEETGNAVTEIRFSKRGGAKSQSDRVSEVSDRMDIDSPSSSSHAHPFASSSSNDTAYSFESAQVNGVTLSLDNKYAQAPIYTFGNNQAVPVHPLEPIFTTGTTTKRRPSNRLSWDHPRDEKRLCHWPSDQSSSSDKENEDPDDGEPNRLLGLDADSDDEDEPEETLPVPRIQYYLPQMAYLDAQRREMEGGWLPEEIEMLKEGEQVANRARDGRYGSPELGVL